MGREGQRERTCRIPRWIFNNVAGVDVIGFQVSSIFEFGEIPDFSWLTEQASKLKYMHDIVLLHQNTTMHVFNITLKCKTVSWFLHESTIYCILVA